MNHPAPEQPNTDLTAVVHEQVAPQATRMPLRKYVAHVVAGAVITTLGANTMPSTAEASEHVPEQDAVSYAQPAQAASAERAVDVGNVSDKKNKKKPAMLWIGDSILAMYNNNPNSLKQGVNDVVDRKLGYRTLENSLGSSSYSRDGRAVPNVLSPHAMLRGEDEKDYCKIAKPNSSVLDRLETRELQQTIQAVTDNDGKVVLAAGRNEGKVYCDDNGNEVQPTVQYMIENVDKSFDIVANNVDNPKDVIVVPSIWAKGEADRVGKRVTKLITRIANKYNFSVVNAWGVLDKNTTVDGTHPNRKGVERLGAFLAKKFKRIFKRQENAPHNPVEPPTTPITPEVPVVPEVPVTPEVPTEPEVPETPTETETPVPKP